MKKYIELTIIPSAEININFIWSKLYMQLHLALVEMKNSDDKVPVGISFPEYRLDTQAKKGITLGKKIRLFAQDEETLHQLNLEKWLERLTDYVHIRRISEVPEKIKGHLVVSRYRVPPNPEKLARRFAKRNKVDLKQALAIFLKNRNEKVIPNYPYINIKSLSGKQDFTFLISQEIVEVEQIGSFSTYGLSSESTVPYW